MSDGLREYGLKVARKGPVVLACGKCQRKMGLKLKKEAKRRGVGVKVVEVGCLKVCPKGGVTVCTGEQMGRGVCSIVWSGKDLGFLAVRDGLSERRQSTRPVVHSEGTPAN